MRPLTFYFCLLTVFAISTSPALPQQQARRVALVIGNAQYPDASPRLLSAVNDATALAAAFGRVGFEVDLKLDTDRQSMQRAIDVFTAKISAGTEALFYFGGFGLQVDNQTYLIPVDALIWTEADVRREGIDVNALLAEMDRKGAKAKIVILDAARKNPFERRFRSFPIGLAPLSASAGTLSLYSAAPDKVIQDGGRRNSVFADELIKELRSSGRTAGEIFNRTRIGVYRASNNEQVPWVTSSLLEDLYFFSSRRNVMGVPAATISPTSSAATPIGPLSETRLIDAARTFKPGDVFRDCLDCPEMVTVPTGSFLMGSNSAYEGPMHRVNIANPIAIGRFEVTFDEWDKCVNEGGCKYRSQDHGSVRGKYPVVNVSWLDAKEFAAWLSKKTGQSYRIPTESEWEYAARGGTKSSFWWGNTEGSHHANCAECGSNTGNRTSPVGTYKPNPFGLYDTAGNAAEWVEDCWNESYRGAPRDGSAWATGQCRLRVLRGGSFGSRSSFLRSAARFRYDADVRYFVNGFRLARDL